MNKNRDKGHRWEVKSMNLLKPLFPNIKTSRNESLTEDAKGIDLCNTGDYAFQCKATKRVDITKWFDHMDTDKTKVVFYKDTKKAVQPEYAVVRVDTLIQLLEKVHGEVEK